MLVNCGNQWFEAWIQTSQTGKRLNEYEPHVSQYPMRQVECHAECVNGTDFTVNLHKWPGVSTFDFKAELRINGRTILAYAWLKTDTTSSWGYSVGPDGVQSTLRFQDMEICMDPDEQPKDVDTIGVIELILVPGSQMPLGFGYTNQVSENPTQKAKPKQAEGSSTVVTGSRGPPRIASQLFIHVPFKAIVNAPCLRLKWKYATRRKLVSMGVIDDPVLQNRIDKARARGHTLGGQAKTDTRKRKLGEAALDEEEVKPTNLENDKEAIIVKLEKRIQALQKEA